MVPRRALAFTKMNGLGNDFVVIDARADDISLSAEFFRHIADRKRGVGCDQIILLRQGPQHADLFMSIFNADGTEAEACGNATRCIAQHLFDEQNGTNCIIETVAGTLHAWREKDGLVAVDFGEPRLAWHEIPLAYDADTLRTPLTQDVLSEPCCVNVGNPHAIFFVDDVGNVPLAELGPSLERHSLFPKYCNIEIAQVLSPSSLKMRVWERGVGITDACGSAACATLVAAVRRGLTDRRASIHMDGGVLTVEWREDGHVILIGPTSVSFHGTVDVTAFVS